VGCDERSLGVMELIQYDAIVIGGGFFGCCVALRLKAYMERVVILEKEDGLLLRASYANQGRVHNGYHYPRSLLTALRSRTNFPRFVSQYAECLDQGTDHYYAVCKGEAMSKVNATQFRTFCERVGAPVTRAPKEIRDLFNPDLVEEVFQVRERVFDAVKLRQRMAKDLDDARVEVRVRSDVVGMVRINGAQIRVDFRSGGRSESVAAGHVFNCTYSRTNRLLAAAGLPAIPLKHELAEIALVEVPPHLSKVALTIMDGPFMSLMPFPPRGVHSLTHVRYTPHRSWLDVGQTSVDAEGLLREKPLETSCVYMLKDAQRYVRSLEDARYVGSIWEIKTVLPQSEVDDSRPILFARDRSLPNLVSVMGGKIDNVYDVLFEIDKCFLPTGEVRVDAGV